MLAKGLPTEHSSRPSLFLSFQFSKVFVINFLYLYLTLYPIVSFITIEIVDISRGMLFLHQCSLMYGDKRGK